MSKHMMNDGSNNYPEMIFCPAKILIKTIIPTEGMQTESIA